MAREAPAGTQSLDRAIALMRVVASYSGRGVRLVEVVERSGLSKPTVHRLLQALEHHGLVSHDAASKLYHLGPETFVMGTLATERFGVHRIALPSLTRLAFATEDTSFLTVRRDWHGVCLHRQEGPFPIRSHVLQAGDRHPLGVGAGNLAILASLPDYEVDEVLAQAAAELEARYRTYSPAMLRDGVARSRSQGYALNAGSLVQGSWAVGVAILNSEGRCEGALSIAAIESRLSQPRREDLAALLRAEAKRLADRLAHPVGATDFAHAPRRRAAKP